MGFNFALFWSCIAMIKPVLQQFMMIFEFKTNRWSSYLLKNTWCRENDTLYIYSNSNFVFLQNICVGLKFELNHSLYNMKIQFSIQLFLINYKLNSSFRKKVFKFSKVCSCPQKVVSNPHAICFFPRIYLISIWTSSSIKLFWLVSLQTRRYV